MPYNSSTVVTTVPSSTKRRSRIRIGPVSKFSSAQHGRLVPNFIKPIFPGDTFTMKDFAGFCYADKSEKLPLSSIYFDQFFFFVPFRLIDRKNWEKVLGYRENPLDKKIYSVPQLKINANLSDIFDDADTAESGYTQADIDRTLIHFLPQYLNNAIAEPYEDFTLKGSAYPLMAYWLLYNEYFRSEQLDNAIDIDTTLLAIDNLDLYDYCFSGRTDAADILDAFEELHLIPERVNKLPDILTRGMITPQRSPDGQPVPIYLAGLAPVTAYDDTQTPPQKIPQLTSNDDQTIIESTSNGQIYIGATSGQYQGSEFNMYADLSSASAIDINQLRLAFAIQSLYETKGRFGTRYISYLRGVWGLIVPDSAIDRPEYLGGCRLELNNMPVLNTASDLAAFSGYSATLFQGAQFDKTFLEYGFVIGLHCERIRHVYPQGCDLDVWDKKVELDFYNPAFAELGYMGQKKSLVYNGNETIFNYNEAWPLERAQLSRADGIFGTLGGDTFAEYRQKWLYADYYDEAPTFNSKWLKEPTENVARTMTGELIVGANNAIWGHQYMFEFRFVYDVTRIIPVYSEPATL